MLHIVGLPKLSSLPQSLGYLTSLQELQINQIKYCDALAQLPECVGELPSLRVFQIRELRSLTCLPQSLGHLTSLQELGIGMCEALGQLPNRWGTPLSKEIRDMGLAGPDFLSAASPPLKSLRSWSARASDPWQSGLKASLLCRHWISMAALIWKGAARGGREKTGISSPTSLICGFGKRLPVGTSSDNGLQFLSYSLFWVCAYVHILMVIQIPVGLTCIKSFEVLFCISKRHCCYCSSLHTNSVN